MSKVTAIIIGFLVLAFGGFVAWSIISSNLNAVNYDEIDPAKVVGPMEGNGYIGDHVRGREDSPVTFVEYGDFQCAGCAAAHPKIDTLEAQYGDRVAFIFRNYPIPGHPNSRAASTAAEAAGLQGYFSEMATAIYANQATWSYAEGSARTDIFVELFIQAAPAGDPEQFRTDISDKNISKKITFDYELGVRRSAVTATPSFYINGEHVDHSGASDDESFYRLMHDMLDAQLEASDLPTGPLGA